MQRLLHPFQPVRPYPNWQAPFMGRCSVARCLQHRAFLALAATILSLTILLVSLSPRLLVSPAHAASVPAACTNGTQDSGALYQICMPAAWNGDLLVYAHGYVSPIDPLAIPAESGQIADAANLLGYAFATTSYSTNGLAVLEGKADILDLVEVFSDTQSIADEVFLLGFSEGGLITTLAVEQHPDVFTGGLAGCGPLGDFQRQINYFGDFRLVFDYFFPGLIPGSPIDIPPDLLPDWPNHYQTVIEPVVTDPANAHLLDQLFQVTGAPYDPADLDTRYASLYDALRYNVMTTNDGIAKLGGQPFDNHDRVYAGSADDNALNAAIPRYTADPAAIAAIEAGYQTTGQLTIPLVTIHTTLDPIVPAWHTPLYRVKVIESDNLAQHDHIEIGRYGHCNFEQLELLNVLALLLDRVNNPPPYQPVSRLFLPITPSP
jgi:pimeloyl-ACP methyl ester carboxylesterase